MQPIKILAITGLLLLLAAACAHVPAPSVSLEPSLGEAKIFDYRGVRINYYEAGQGPPVLLLHGFGASAYAWRFLGPVLAKDHRVLTIDLKGFGLSAKPEDGKYTLRDQADLVAEFIRARDLHDLVVIGHSMGGGVALMAYFKVRGTRRPGSKSWCSSTALATPRSCPCLYGSPRCPDSVRWEASCSRPGSPPPGC